MKAFWIGKSIIAAPDVDNALLVMGRHEPADKWSLADVRELSADELRQQVDEGGDMSVADALQAVIVTPEPSRLSAVTQGRGALIRWDYPTT
ncbi:hypothetical protein ABRP29_06115 [Pseudomonas sp. WHRI 8822A]|uniref:hypothetical protein n=1 Tax=Pseudomonas sp. WHRI 8822A TaxID=3162568 RepID=UPI0032EEAA78